MTESEWLEITKVVRGNWDRFCVERQQFDTFYVALKEFDVRHVREAADRIIREYAYPPIVATFTVYIEQVQKDERYRVERELTEKKEIEDAKRKPKPVSDYGVRWLRFTSWMLQEKNTWPKEGADVEKLKVKFEKEHPNWQPRKRSPVPTKRGGMTRIGDVVQDSIGGLAKKEEL